MTSGYDSPVSLDASRTPERAAARTRVQSSTLLSHPWLLPLALALVTLVVFSPALLNDFVEWDDDVNIVKNPNFRGLGWTQLRWMFTAGLMGHYIPVTWITLGIDYTLWGLNPLGYHLTNLLLHAVNVVLFYAIARRLLATATSFTGGALTTAAAVAALVFGLHPLRVESVVWATERRDVLSGCFYLLTILGYLRACEAEGRRRLRWLAASIGAYVLALGSKSIVMPLPFVLLLLDIYPLRRLGLPWGGQPWAEVRRVLVEKIPYAVLAVLGAAVAYHMVKTHTYLTPMDTYPWVARAAMVAYSLWFYVSKSVFPLGLSPLYELPAVVNPLEARFLLPILGVTAISAAVLGLARRWPAGLGVWAFYVITLAPVAGIVHAGHQLAHDRYSYLSCLGLALLAGAGAAAVVRASERGALRRPMARLVAGAAAAWFVGLGVATWYQVQVWRDSDTLWRYAVQVDDTCSICQSNLGAILSNQGLLALGLPYYERALELRPDRVNPNYNISLTLVAFGRYAQAEARLKHLLERHPDEVRGLNGLAIALMKQGRYDEAERHLRHALEVNAQHAATHTNLGIALVEMARMDEALAHHERAVALAPDSPEPRFWLAQTYLKLDRVEAAREQYQKIASLDVRWAAPLRPVFATER